MLGLALSTTAAIRLLAALVLTWWLPGALLVAHWRLPDLDLPLAAALALGMGLCWMMLWALIAHWIPGPIGFWPLMGAYALGALVLLVALLPRRVEPLSVLSRSEWMWMTGLLVLAFMLRVPGLGYHELHVDEVSVLRSARLAIEGVEDVLAAHPKGPGEILVALTTYRAVGNMDEWVGRLPFALLSVASVVAVAALGQRMFALPVGVWAGILLALNGFALGLSRIVQYQAAMLLFSVLIVLASWSFARTSRPGWLTLMALLGAFGVILHYELALVAPVLLLCFWWGVRRATGTERARIWRAAAISGVGGLLLMAACYVPVVLHPNFVRTQSYLGNRVGDSVNFNLPFFVEMGTFYNSIYFFAGLVLLVGIGVLLGWRTKRAPTGVLIVWFVPYLVLYLFIMQFPGTHFYMLMPSWSILAAIPLAAATRQSSSQRVPWQRGAAYALIGVWLALSAGYLYVMFFRQEPEYLVNYPETRIPLYWAPYGEEIPQQPRFGFPIREGWKTVGVLAEWGYLDDSYSSNERSRHLRRWYVDRISRRELVDDPDYVFVARHLQQRDPAFDDDWVEENYIRVGEVRVREEPRIEIWAREPLPVPWVVFDAEHFESAFDESIPPLEGAALPPATIQNEPLSTALTLASARLSSQTLSAGETLHIALEWLPTEPLPQSYKLFVHLTGQDGQPLAQWDGVPGLNTWPTDRWAVNELFEDHVLLPIPSDLPPGRYDVLAGLYDPMNGERVGGKAISIGSINIR